MVDRCFKCEQRPTAGSKLRMCGGCHTAKYCTDLCQRGHWSEHKPVCKTLGAARETRDGSIFAGSCIPGWRLGCGNEAPENRESEQGHG